LYYPLWTIQSGNYDARHYIDESTMYDPVVYAESRIIQFNSFAGRSSELRGLPDFPGRAIRWYSARIFHMLISLDLILGTFLVYPCSRGGTAIRRRSLGGGADQGVMRLSLLSSFQFILPLFPPTLLDLPSLNAFLYIASLCSLGVPQIICIKSPESKFCQ
jgi:hypothetical protein